MRIFTFTPAAFEGNARFFTRDSGLTCRALQELGIESKAVMFAPDWGNDLPDVLRVAPHDLARADWWRQWRLDAVVSYSWAQPRNAPYLQAMRAANIPVFLRLDCGDVLFSPLSDPNAYLRRSYFAFRDAGRSVFVSLAAALAKMAANLSPSFYLKPLMDYLSLADAVGVELPMGVEKLDRIMVRLGRADLAPRLRVIGHPVSAYMKYDGTAKKPSIVAVGRWESYVKNAPLLMGVLRKVLMAEADYEAVVLGSGDNRLRKLAASFPGSVRDRIRILGNVPNNALVSHYNVSQVLLVTSRFESFHIGAAEALCCGCSVVGPGQIGSMRWFSSEDSGTTAVSYNLEGLATALTSEIAAWRGGRRNPGRISGIWLARVAATSVAHQILHALELSAVS